MIPISSSVFTFPIIPGDIEYRYEFQTSFDPTVKGSEARVVRWGEYRQSLVFPEMPLQLNELASLKNFHSARGGKREGFLVKIPDNHNLPVSKGRLLPLNDTGRLFQIIRVYSIDSVRTYKPIRRPLPGTVRVFINGIESASGWAVNLSNGQIEFTSPQQTGELTISCEFYTPMRFDNDTIEGLQISGGQDDLFRYIENPSRALLLLRSQVGSIAPIYQVSGLILKEVHIPIAANFYVDSDFASISTDFSYPFVPQNVKTSNFVVEIDEALSGVENTVERYSRTITRYLPVPVKNSELDYLLNYFLVAKGRAISFNGKRFDTDQFVYIRTSPDYSIMSEIPIITCPDNRNRRYQVFGRYFSKHLYDPCNTVRHWRTVGPFTLFPGETPDEIEVRRTVSPGGNGAVWTVAKKGADHLREGNLIDIERSDFDRKILVPETFIGGFWGIYIRYRDKNLPCNGTFETPSFPRGDDFEITDIIEITDGAIGGALPLATILKIERKDGEIKTYTSWDSDLIIDGITYLSNAGITPTAVSNKSDMSVDNLEVSTFFDDISEVDILSGKYENALVSAAIVDISRLSKNPISLFGGEIGEISAGDTRFTFELRSKSARLNQPVSVKTSDFCPYSFCDSDCGLDIQNYTLTGFTVSEILPSKIAPKAFKINPAPPGNFRNGYVEFISGQLAGQKYDIKNTYQSASEIQLWSNLPYGLAVGDELNIVRGCSKTPEACKSYNNFANYGGWITGGNWFVGDDALLSGS